MNPFVDGLLMSLNWEAVLAVLIGVVSGIVVGAIPGLTFTMGMVLLLPLTFKLPAVPAMASLFGMYIGGMTGGSVSAVLMGIPGTPSAAATVFDGFPMARKGQAGKALGTAVVVSIIGGIFSLLVMILISPQVAALAIKFGSPEIFALVFFGLSTICGISEGSILRGLISGVLGLLLVTVGLDPIVGVSRFTFEIPDLLRGVDLVAAMIGMFAIPQVLKGVIDGGKDLDTTGLDDQVKASLPSVRELFSHWGLIIRCALMGTGIGAIPGAGGPIAAFLAYDHAKRFSKHPERFGQGELTGIIAPETANNAVTGGALIPMFTLGIPGDPTTAVMMGGLLIHGLRPGPLLFQENPTVVYGLYGALILANLFTLLVQLNGIRFFVRLLKLPNRFLLPTILAICVVGSYALNNNVWDVYVMAFFGLLGYLMQKFRFPVTPVILALVLGSIMESEFRRALIMSSGNFSVFVTSPVAAVLLGAAVIVLGRPLFKAIFASRSGVGPGTGPGGGGSAAAQP